MDEATAARFWAKVHKTDGCWLWTAAKFRHGDGAFNAGYSTVHAHRFLWETIHGPMQPGLELDHLCRNPSCVNPAHLEAVTHGENIRRGELGILGGPKLARLNRAKTACLRGHPLDYTAPDGSRACRTCRKDAWQRYRAKKRANQ